VKHSALEFHLIEDVSIKSPKTFINKAH